MRNRKFSSHNLMRGGANGLWVRCENVLCRHVVRGAEELIVSGYMGAGKCPACKQQLPLMSKEMEAPIRERRFVTREWLEI